MCTLSRAERYAEQISAGPVCTLVRRGRRESNEEMGELHETTWSAPHRWPFGTAPMDHRRRFRAPRHANSAM